MAYLLVCLLSLLAAGPGPTTRDIERAFLQNNPQLLYANLSGRRRINVSLPDPIFFSDQLSSQQTHFLFKDIFRSYTTFEFYSEQNAVGTENGFPIYRARWSFRDRKNGDQFLFYVFFFLEQEPLPGGRAWKIIEIKAKKI